jgi:hypothetical protein
VQQHIDLAGLPVEAVLLIADGRMARRAADRKRDGLMAVLPFLSFLSRVSGTRTSPAMTTRLVVVSVSQATRTVHGSTPVLRASL